MKNKKLHFFLSSNRSFEAEHFEPIIQSRQRLGIIAEFKNAHLRGFFSSETSDKNEAFHCYRGENGGANLRFGLLCILGRLCACTNQCSKVPKKAG